jgi:hypothetical protein
VSRTAVDSIRSVEVTRRQRNEIFETLTDRGIDPKDCDLDTEQGRVTHLPTESYFRFAYLLHDYSTSWHVADGPHDSGWGTGGKSWAQVLEELAYWADEVRYVTDTPDFWAEMRQVPEVMAASQVADASNAPFTADEQAEIARRLDEVKQLVRDQFELTSEQLATVDQRLDDAEHASKRLGRKDWMLMFYGGVMSTFITDAVPPSVIQTVLTTVLHGIAHFFGIGGPPPIIST